jgi:LacI family transcriptional regulator
MIKETTIYDIAKILGISPATVSRALNDNPAVNENTRQKIQKKAAEMGYRSNTFASNLRKQRTNAIGVIVPRLNSHFQSSVIAGMEKVANEAGYNLIISQSLESAQKEIANAKTMFNSRIDGLLVSLAYDTENIDHLKPFIKKGIPVLFYDRIHDSSECAGIVIDNIKAGYEATTHLIEQGCKNIIHLTGSLIRNVYSDRLKGYRYALIDHDLPFMESSVMISKLNEEAGIETVQQILKKASDGENMPDGIFVSNDTCAVGCIKALKQAGIQVPQDMAVVGFNNDPISRVIEPNLTTINYPGVEMGEVAVRNLISHLDGLTDIVSTNTITLRAELIVRESSIKEKLSSIEQ